MMDTQKREQIIKCAIQEFANHSYADASTNTIVENAGISKGLLFHYYGSKKSLYEETVSFVLRKLVSMTDKYINWDETDLLERIRQSTMMRIRLAEQYPFLHQLLINVIKNEGAQYASKPLLAISKKFDINGEYIFERLFNLNIDYKKFADQNSIETNIQIIKWTLEKYSESVFSRLTTGWKPPYLGFIEEELDTYIIALKKAFYQQ